MAAVHRKRTETYIFDTFSTPEHRMVYARARFTVENKFSVRRTR
jgi:hypothetical protein